MARPIKSLTYNDVKELGSEFDDGMVAGPPPEPELPGFDLPPEEEFAIVEPVVAAAPPPLPTEEELEAKKALLQKKRTRRGELVMEQAAVEDRLSLVAEQLAAAQQENRRRRHDNLIEPSPDKELASVEARETVRRLYEEESELLESKAAFAPAADDLDRQIVQLAREIDAARVARVKAELEAGRAERARVLLDAMAAALLLHELSGGLPVPQNEWTGLLNQSIGFDRSVTDEARKLREKAGLL